MKTYAVIDFGSNTIRLCIYRIDAENQKQLSKKNISTLLNYKEMAGISSYIKDGILIDKGIKKAARTIKKHVERSRYFNCDEVCIFATAVLRNCKNSQEAKAAIEKECQEKITILSNEEEAHLGLVGAKLDSEINNATVVDIGGGSTELTSIKEKSEIASISIPQGSLSSYASHVAGVLPTKDERAAIAKAFGKRYPKNKEVYENIQLIGIGGAIRSAAKVYGDIFQAGKRSSLLLPEHIETILNGYSQEPEKFIHRAIQTIPDRIHTFIPGCILIREVFKKTGAQELRIAKYGVREGFLIEKII